MNALLAPWTTPYALPPFDRVAPEDYPPAFEAAMAQHRAEIEAIKADASPPSFDNTIGALERAGRSLGRVAAVFYNLAGAHTSDALQAVEREMAPKLADHRNAIILDEALYARVAAVPEVGLGAEEARVLDLTRRRFVKAGAALDAAGRKRLAEIGSRLATLGTQFGQTVLKDEADWVMWLDARDLEGLPAWLVAAAAAEGRRRGEDGRHAITLSRSSVEPFLAFSPRRDLRETAWRAWAARGTGAGEAATNWPLIAETLTLRDERARLLGFESYAHWRLSDQMAKTPAAVADLLEKVWTPARARAEAEAADLQALAAEEGANIDLAPWDWRYYAEKQRRRLHDIDEAETKPYLALDSVIAAAFDVATRLFGLSFRAVDGLALHHPDARAWEVSAPDGTHVGLFIGDYHARPSKRSGAWASGFRGQQKLWAPGRPVIVNIMNFAEGDPTLLTFDDARTLFHEFGHALHGLMSAVTYPSIAGTAVARDFVELPSQLYEHWLSTPEVLRSHARHVETGEPMPEALIERLQAAATFNQGFATVEYCASALVDLHMHTRAGEAAADPEAFQAAVLAEIGMPAAIAMRHASPHFLHVFAGEGYASGYYSYLWSELMDADAFAAFEEAGDAFDPALARRLAEHVLSAGGSREPEELYTAFRGRLPGVEPLLKGRGLSADAA
ncbi:MAG: M3 family metallopeptidase [Pseudomonadota bacterium]